ncbi:quinone oxidoreductase family protein [Nakamurella sp. GG22]
MRAAVVHTLGEPPTLGESPDPAAADGHSVVRVTAAPIVPLDLLCATGTSYFGRPAVPYVPGVQGVGVVETSPTLDPGTRVWFATSAGMAPGNGSLAARCVVAEDDLVPVTADLPDVAIAALGLSAVAAWMSLTWRGRFRPGERVVVLGAGGAVGQVAVGAARLLGASRVVAVCRPGPSEARARRAGADDVVASTHDVDRLARDIARSAGGDVDIVIDPVFGKTATAASRTLGPGGRLVNLGGASGDMAEFSSAVLRGKSIEILGYTNNALTPRQRADALGAILSHAVGGALAVEHVELPLSRIEQAWVQTKDGAGERFVVTP